jgi:CBS domain containing-hemolysin-like protein
MTQITFVDVLWRLAGVLALVLANGFFVSAEFSIVASRKTRIDQLVAEGRRGARAARRATTNPDKYIAATQLGITMASLGLGWIGEPAVASLIQPGLSSFPAAMAEATAHTVSVAIAFAFVTALHIVLGELAPKTVALEHPETTALLVIQPTELFMTAFSPFIRLLNGTGRAVVKALGMPSKGGHAMVHSEEELKMLVTASQEAGVIEEQEEQMLHRVFGFADLTAGQVMVPRTEVVAVGAGMTREALVDHIARGGYSRVPVYRENLDDIVGILHVTDLLKVVDRGGSLNPLALAREALTVPETLPADDVLAEMRRRGVREALVIDEYGGTAGLVTFESLMERIVGDLGSTVTGSPRVNVLEDGSAEIDGLVLVTEVNQQFGLHIDQDTYTTVGGYVLGRLGRRPQIGDVVDVEGRRLRVDALDGIRIARVWLSTPANGTPPKPPANPPEAASGHSQ